jgi:hypothetical protein
VLDGFDRFHCPTLFIKHLSCKIGGGLLVVLAFRFTKMLILDVMQQGGSAHYFQVGAFLAR